MRTPAREPVPGRWVSPSTNGPVITLAPSSALLAERHSIGFLKRLSWNLLQQLTRRWHRPKGRNVCPQRASVAPFRRLQTCFSTHLGDIGRGRKRARRKDCRKFFLDFEGRSGKRKGKLNLVKQQVVCPISVHKLRWLPVAQHDLRRSHRTYLGCRSRWWPSRGTVFLFFSKSKLRYCDGLFVEF